MASFSERQEFYADIVVTAVEGGIGYWSAVESYSWFFPNIDGGTGAPGKDNTALAVASLVPADDDEAHIDSWPVAEPGKLGAVLDNAAVTRAVGKIVRGEQDDKLRADIIKTVREAYREWDAGEIDAEIADVIAQVAIFGEVHFS